jgi:hypothetical protein
MHDGTAATLATFAHDIERYVIAVCLEENQEKTHDG